MNTPKARPAATAALALALLSLAGHALAQYPAQMWPGMPMQPGFAGMPRGQVAPNPLALLQLGEDQLRQMSTVIQEASRESAALMHGMSGEGAKLPALFAAADPDPQAIGATYAKIFELQRQMSEAGVQAYKDQIAVFTPEQRALWDRMRQAMMPQTRPQPAAPSQ